jgi:hypothetical protein
MLRGVFIRIVVSAVALLALAAGTYFWQQASLKHKTEAEMTAVQSVVEGFGRVLKNVSLLSPNAAQEMEENYKEFLDPVLLSQWKADPSRAVGRMTSSPWPDSIEIASIKQFGSGAYDVSGKIIDMTSQGKMAGSRSVEIGVVNFEGKWLISGMAVTAGGQSASWKDYQAEGFSFRYPEQLPVQYVSTYAWPPTIKVIPGTFACATTPLEVSSLSRVVTQEVLGGMIYCIDVKHEGAAGSIYAVYDYTVPKNGRLVTVNFTLRYPSCGAYNEAENQACTLERETFDLNGLVNSIVQSIGWDATQPDNSLAGQLADCLPKSDTASRDKCLKLQEQITDFDSCAMAGFPIMESYPLQCMTADGRSFTQQGTK